jgi:GH15 family glucan-1,4-alpha-glucosidase
MQDIVLSSYPSYQTPPDALDVPDALACTHQYWADWVGSAPAESERYGEMVTRSLVFLRALTHEETGGMVAASTTSLPELLHGDRNWDYR